MADWDGGAALDIVGAGTVARAGNSSDSRIDVVAKLGIMPYSLFRSFGNNPFLWKLCWQFFSLKLHSASFLRCTRKRHHPKQAGGER